MRPSCQASSGFKAPTVCDASVEGAVFAGVECVPSPGVRFSFDGARQHCLSWPENAGEDPDAVFGYGLCDTASEAATGSFTAAEALSWQTLDCVTSAATAISGLCGEGLYESHDGDSAHGDVCRAVIGYEGVDANGDPSADMPWTCPEGCRSTYDSGPPYCVLGTADASPPVRPRRAEPPLPSIYRAFFASHASASCRPPHVIARVFGQIVRFIRRSAALLCTLACGRSAIWGETRRWSCP